MGILLEFLPAFFAYRLGCLLLPPDDFLELVFNLLYRPGEDCSKFCPLVLGLIPSLVCFIGTPCCGTSEGPRYGVPGALIMP